MINIKEPYILSIDIGTSSIRALVFDGEGNPCGDLGARMSYSMTSTPDGGAYIDVNLICDYVFNVIDQAVAKISGQRIPVSAISMCTFWHNVAGVDANGNPVTPLLSWNDTRPETVLPQLITKINPDDFTFRTGCPMHASYLPAKILWMWESMPLQARQVKYWMSLGEYLLFKICHERLCSVSMASGTGLLHGLNGEWDEKVLSCLPATVDQLSPLFKTHLDKGQCHETNQVSYNPAGFKMGLEFSPRWPLLHDAEWFPALGDGACSNIGSGCVLPARVAMMVGTSGAMRTVWRGGYQQPPAGLWCYRIDAERPIQGGALSNGGNLFEWMTTSLQLPSPVVLEKELTAMKPDGHGLTILPFFAGQRSPRWNPQSTAVIHGMRTSTRPIEILRAGLESVAYRFALIHELLMPVLAADHILVATGGGLLRSPAWIQIMADVLGCRVFVSGIEEASCRGAALLALEALGAIKDISEADAHLKEAFSPNPESHEIYQRGLERHLDLEGKF